MVSKVSKEIQQQNSYIFLEIIYGSMGYKLVVYVDIDYIYTHL